MGAWKETHYFAGARYWQRFGAFRGDRPPSEAEYLHMFDRVRARRRLGESSVWYLHSPTAAQAIRRYRPDAQIVVTIRHPAEMLASLHSEFVYIGIEPERDFLAALRLDSKRTESGPPPGFPPNSYRAAAGFSGQLRRYLEVFGGERVHVVLYEEFRDETAATFSKLCEFLDVDPAVAPDFAVVNPRRQARSHILQRLLVRPPQSLKPLVHSGSAGSRARVREALVRLNTKPVPPGPVEPEARDLLEPLVVREAAALEQMLGINLSAWTTSPGAEGRGGG